jgi:hypothetical protein
LPVDDPRTIPVAARGALLALPEKNNCNVKTLLIQKSLTDGRYSAILFYDIHVSGGGY